MSAALPEPEWLTFPEALARVSPPLDPTDARIALLRAAEDGRLLLRRAPEPPRYSARLWRDWENGDWPLWSDNTLFADHHGAMHLFEPQIHLGSLVSVFRIRPDDDRALTPTRPCRPKDTGFRRQDTPIAKQMNAMVQAGTCNSLTGAARTLIGADGKGAPGGTIEAKIARLVKLAKSLKNGE